MSRGPKQMFFQRSHTDGQQAHKKMLNFSNHQGNANSNLNAIALHTCQNGCYEKDKRWQALLVLAWKSHFCREFDSEAPNHRPYSPHTPGLAPVDSAGALWLWDGWGGGEASMEVGVCLIGDVSQTSHRQAWDEVPQAPRAPRYHSSQDSPAWPCRNPVRSGFWEECGSTADPMGCFHDSLCCPWHLVHHRPPSPWPSIRIRTYSHKEKRGKKLFSRTPSTSDLQRFRHIPHTK